MNATYRKYDVFLADVPFEDTPQSKVRPVLILSVEPLVVECLKMTSRAPRKGEYALQMWQCAGLAKSTTVRVSKRLRLPPERMRKKLGHLHAVDVIAIQNILIG